MSHLALALIDVGAIVTEVGSKLEPHKLCGYLFELAQAFTRFYEHCPRPHRPRRSHLQLQALSLHAAGPSQGMLLLGIQSPDKM